MNYFELFDLPISLKPDKSTLSQKYFALQKQFHPDFYTQSDEFDQMNALEKSSLVNKALKVLQQPDETLQYVLQLKGVLSADEKFELPGDFLMDMMDLNEKMLEEDATAFRQEVEALEQALYEPVKDRIENYQDGSITREQLLQLKEYYFKKKYLHRILDRMDD